MVKRTRLARRTTVPVSSRDARAQQPPARLTFQRPKLWVVAVIIGVVLIVLLAIGMPLRNYYQGRTEIARLNESIAAQEAEKTQILEEIERYEDEAYIRQEARRRLGVIAPGETAYRIIDPRMDQDQLLSTPHGAAETLDPWYTMLWNSIAEPPAPAPTAPEAGIS
ncbi:MAG TPA: septum formation initiator family protein [Corynebacterium sp.]|nr:septum formation initiator family protein [Corynebacterium sp.]